ncbi:MAG: SPOR domain-containing protein [Rhodospirillaceae bacterium]|nr:SPOR domain-containing protein [Rhodospirillaceae bacterium]
MSRARTDLKVTASDALEFEAVETNAPKPRRGFRALLWIVAFCVIGAGGWILYRDKMMTLVMGDDGDLPVIRAMAGPVKVRPENPGGLQVPNRDKLVYGRLQSDKMTVAENTIERLLPKPEAPLAIRPATPASAAFSESTEQRIAAGTARVVQPTPQTARVPAVTDVTSVAPPPPAAPTGLGNTRENAPVSLTRSNEPIRLKKGAVRAPRPAAIAPRQPIATPAPPPRAPLPTKVAARSAPRSPAAPPAGTAPSTTQQGAYRVQLAAARTPERARVEWDRMRRKNLDLLGDLGLTVTKADLGPKKGIFYRLRVGPLTSDSQARTLCKALSKRKMGCLVVKPGQ